MSHIHYTGCHKAFQFRGDADERVTILVRNSWLQNWPLMEGSGSHRFFQNYEAQFRTSGIENQQNQLLQIRNKMEETTSEMYLNKPKQRAVTKSWT